MKRYIKTYNAVEGFHNYPDAPEWCAFLASRHRHVFIVKCLFEVEHNNRHMEIIATQAMVAAQLHEAFGRPCEFGSSSCETIAQFLLERFENMIQCEVLEDGFGGAILRRD